MSTLQGARLFHDGQFEGARTHIPVFLGRGPDEPVDRELQDFYVRLVRAVAESELGRAEWSLCDCTGWPDNDSHRQLVAWAWRHGGARSLVVVNLSPADAQARVHLPWDDVGTRSWSLVDRLDGASFERAGDEIAADGLYVALPGWGTHFLRLTPVAVGAASVAASAAAR
jgi:hypothetical protein